MHLRNRGGRTPLFLAASAGRKEHVVLLRHSGAHLHPPELSRAWLRSVQNAPVWKAAGLSPNGEGIKVMGAGKEKEGKKAEGGIEGKGDMPIIAVTTDGIQTRLEDTTLG